MLKKEMLSHVNRSVRLAKALERDTIRHIANARRFGATWEEIANELEMPIDEVHQKYSAKVATFNSVTKKES